MFTENSKDLQKLINAEVNGWKEEDDDDVNEWEEMEGDGNMPCDYSGICAGISCPLYWKCQH